MLCIELISNFTGITGTTIKLDSNGDSEGNFSVYSFIRNLEKENSSECGYHLRFVGQFQHQPNSTSPVGRSLIICLYFNTNL